MIRPRTTPRSVSLLATLLLAIAACAHVSPSTLRSTSAIADVDDRMAPPASSTRQILSSAEIATVIAKTAYDAVHRLRPEYLRTSELRRVGRTAQSPVVYIGTLMADGIDALSDIPVGVIDQIRYVLPGDATSRYGANYGGGLIIVRLRRR